VLKEVINDVRRGIVAAKDLVVGADRAKIEILLGGELAGDFVHVAVELFEQALIARKHGGDRLLVTGKVCAHERFEDCAIAIFRRRGEGRRGCGLSAPRRISRATRIAASAWSRSSARG